MVRMILSTAKDANQYLVREQNKRPEFWKIPPEQAAQPHSRERGFLIPTIPESARHASQPCLLP